jgi:hypothetical protein
MNALSILFRTSLFNLSKVHEHFINPCCFGEDLADWFGDRLTPKGVQTSTPYQEDWGWELPVKLGADSYYLCMSGNADRPGNNEGEWRIIVQKRRSIWERLTGRGKITVDDPLLKLLEQILSREPNVTKVHLEP